LPKRADIIAVDICAQIDSVPYPLSTLDDLPEPVARYDEPSAPMSTTNGGELRRKNSGFDVERLPGTIPTSRYSRGSYRT
jgi:hypothetical protein